MSELKLITPRRNFLIKALGFTAAGATLPISIITADDARARIDHHRAELLRAFQDYYGSEAVRSYIDVRPCKATYMSYGNEYPALSSIMICASSDDKAQWSIEGHAWKTQQPGVPRRA